ncbi:putative transglutaminase-like cysteine proteinase [Sphingomonas kyeonggiensis]|uniref:transglutaminase-like cysteine peptidase n=1 Tax=Sphingomonas kyeonggiensis TaxID=1268553 RepID=UPI0027842082|nr:transglutaminase-like cysteine peptidase [Sphingomonas kyeonggiensis]MDQ0251466.1 putative transglutaminase-like cysteine proteinase [Sphingomonas kyeonggiensis]
MRRVSSTRLALAWAALASGQSLSAAAAEAPESRERADVALRLADAPRWTDVLAREAGEAGGPAPLSLYCRMPADELPVECGVRGWRAAFAGLRGLPAADQVSGVQAVVNRLPYVSDLANWGMADRWETPAEMFARGGDCEDFALTKYFALRDLGLPEAAMRIAVVWDSQDAEQHAVLFVEAGGQNWVLDNKFAAPVPAADVATRYRVIWSVNRDGARLAALDSGEGEGPRLRVARGGRMLVLRIRPVRREAVAPAGGLRVARAVAPAGIARLGAALSRAEIAVAPVGTASKNRENSVRNALSRAGEIALGYAADT